MAAMGMPVSRAKLDELRQHNIILFQPVVLQFNVVIALTEEVAIPQALQPWRARNRRARMACGTSPARQADRQMRPS